MSPDEKRIHDMKIAEIIARLDTLEKSMLDSIGELRVLRYDLFDTLDNHPDDLVE